MKTKTHESTGTLGRNDKLEEKVKEIVQETLNPFENYASDNDTRQREYVVFRQAVMTILKNIFNYNWHNAGAVFGKTHATAIHSVLTINNLRETDSSFRELMNEIYDRADKLPFRKKAVSGKSGELCLALRQSMTDHMNEIKVSPDEKESWFVINAEDQDIYFSEIELKWILS